MAHPLDGANLKIVWAEQHLKRIKDEIAVYLYTNPHELVRQKDVQGRWTTAPVIRVHPDETLCLMVGDCLTNTRAALDYVMFQIALRWFDPPFNITNLDHRSVTSFPLFQKASTDPKSAEANRFAKLQHFMPNIPADVFPTIKRVQPYNGGYEPLWWLHELVNTDKHRLLLVAKSDIPVSQFWVRVGDTAGIPYGPTTAIDHKAIYHLGGYSTNAGVSDLPEDVKVEYEPTIHVTFDDPPMPIPAIKYIPIDSILQQIIETVRDVLPKFDQFFL